MAWDTIVIGSGSGGLTAAVALARQGQRVLVLEQHYLPGGWTHSFTLDGHRFSPGVHYIGDLQPGGGVRRMYEGLGLGHSLEFYELAPDGYDHVLIGDDRFDIPKGKDRFIERLAVRFPHERRGIQRYFDDLVSVASALEGLEDGLSFTKLLMMPFKAPALLRFGLRTLDALLDAHITDPALRAILAAQCGNHGLPPSRVSLPMHAAITRHYLDGGYYPKGGAKAIPGALIKQLRKCGGSIRMRTRVKRILTKGSRAIGVETDSGEQILCNDVISNADPAITFSQLLPKELAHGEKRKVEKTEYSLAPISVFCTVDMDLSAYDSGNYWWYRHGNVERLYEEMLTKAPEDQVDVVFATITTLKDPSERPADGRHTVELFTFQPFEPWQFDKRSDAYEAKKKKIGARILHAAENIIPGISKGLRFAAVGSPLTNDFFCAAVKGSAYGTAKTPHQLGPFAFSVKTSVCNLFSCGQSTLGHGVAGAALSGLTAAKEILGAKTVESLLGPADGSLRVYDWEPPKAERIDIGNSVARTKLGSQLR